MPRIRMLRPEHRQHRKVGPLGDREYRLWVSMISEADDSGRLVCDPGQLRVQTWGYHPKVTFPQVEAAIQTLARLGLIVLYKAQKIRYAAFPSWAEHQHPKYPTESRLPPPPEALPQDSPKIPPTLPPVVVVGIGSNSIGSNRDGKGLGAGKGNRDTAGDASPAPPLVASAFSNTNQDNDNGHSTPQSTSNGPRRPARGEFQDLLVRIRQQHPELAEADAQALATREYQASLQ